MRNAYVLMVIEALLLMLLFFSQGYARYATLALFGILALALLIGSLMKKTSYVEVLTVAAVVCSGIFILLFTTSRTGVTDMLGVGVTLLFLVTAMLQFMSRLEFEEHKARLEQLSTPKVPNYYDMDYDEYSEGYGQKTKQVSQKDMISPKSVVQNIVESVASQQPTRPSKKISIIESQITDSDIASAEKTFEKKPEPVMHVKHDNGKSTRDRLAAKAVLYELEREASELSNAQGMMQNMQTYNVDRKVHGVEDELLKETDALEDVQRQMDALKNDSKRLNQAKTLKKELEKEASEIMKVQKQIEQIHKLKAAKDLERQAKSLMDAQKELKQLKSEKDSQEKKKAGKQIEILTKMAQAQELEREARALKGVQKKMTELKTAKKEKELVKEAKSIKAAQKQVDELKFLERQEKIVKQAKDIAKAQKKIDDMNKGTKRSLEKQVAQTLKMPKAIPLQEVKKINVKTVKAADESFYFSADGGNKFHEPGCMAIKNVPKNKLTLYTNKKDAMKKGLKPCNVCIPK